MEQPLFVLSLDAENNILYVGMGSDHPGLWSRGLFIQTSDVHWLNQKHIINKGEELKVMARTRYRQPLKPALLKHQNDGIYLIFDEAISAIAPGAICRMVCG